MPTVSAQSQEVRQTAATDTTDAFAASSLLPLPPTPYGIRGWRCLRLGLHFVWGGLLTATIYPWIDGAKRLRIKQRWSRRTLTVQILPASPIFPASQSRRALTDAAHAAIARQLSL